MEETTSKSLDQRYYFNEEQSIACTCCSFCIYWVFKYIFKVIVSQSARKLITSETLSFNLLNKIECSRKGYK